MVTLEPAKYLNELPNRRGPAILLLTIDGIIPELEALKKEWMEEMKAQMAGNEEEMAEMEQGKESFLRMHRPILQSSQNHSNPIYHLWKSKRLFDFFY